MKKIILIILTISSLVASGQTTLIGLNSGIALTNINGSDSFNNADIRRGLSIGLSYAYIFKNNFSISADMTYNQRGFREDVIFKDDTGTPTGEKATFKFNYDYLSLPIKTGFYFGKKTYGFGNIGIVPSMLLNAKHITPRFKTDVGIVDAQTIDVTNSVTKFDVAGLVEIGVGYKIKDKYYVFTSATYQQSFTTFTNSDYFTNSKIRHNGLTLSVGLKFSLTKA